MPTGLPGTAFMIRNTLVKRKNGKLIRCNKDSIAIDESEVYGSDTMLDQCVVSFFLFLINLNFFNFPIFIIRYFSAKFLQ